MQSRLRAAIRGAFEESGLDAENNTIGMSFDFEGDGAPLLDMSVSDLRRLQNTMRNNPREMSRMLMGSQQRDGLMPLLMDAVDAARDDVKGWSGGIAVNLSHYA